jgi:5-aminopentanamidase
MKHLRTALFQFAPRPGNLQENLSMILDALARAEEQSTQLLVAPEMSLTGWSLPDPADRDRLTDEVEGVAIPALAAAADRSGVSVVVGGPFRGGRRAPANSAIGIGSDSQQVIYRKIHLFGPERDWWEPGDRADALLEVGSIRVGLTICYDGEYPEVPRLSRLAGAEVLAIPATNMSPYERDQDLVFPTRALENECPVMLCNRVGEERGWSYFGRSLVADARGEILAQAGQGAELLMVDIPVPVGPAEPELSYLARRRPEVYRPIAEAPERTESSRPLVDSPAAEAAAERPRIGGGAAWLT